MVFRYEIPKPARHFKIQPKGEEFSLFTEHATYQFRAK
jgi:hypothetical protein